MSGYEILSLSPTKAEILFLGVPDDYFDRTNNFSLWSIVHLFLTGCLVSQDQGFTDKLDLFRDTNNLMFTVRVMCSLTSKIHLVSKYKANKFVATSEMFQLGKSSLTLKVTISNYSTKELWGKFFVKFVHVDGHTRKSKRLPDWYINRFQDVVDMGNTVPAIPNIPGVPTGAYRTDVKTRFNDLDTNSHVTTRVYFQFFTDCATEASFAGYYKHFKHDMSWYPVKSFDVLMLGESRAGETLTVCTWQDKEDIATIFFSCLKKDKCVMKAVFVYSLEMLEPKLPPYGL